jgi:nucleoid DNA-binding protein
MRTKVDWRSASKENYNIFCKKHPSISLSYDEWMDIIYSFNEEYREYILETGEKVKFPFGFGDFSINKKKRKRLKTDLNGRDFINLPVDWKKTKEKGKIVYNFNFHTDGYFFGWMWFKGNCRIKNADLWYFKATRSTSRLLAHYINVNESYQNLYREWRP